MMSEVTKLINLKEIQDLKRTDKTLNECIVAKDLVQ